MKISELIQDNPTCNGHEFLGWTKNSWAENPEIITELSKSDITGSGTVGDISYENGIAIEPLFSIENPVNTGNYYLTLYPGIGQIEGKDSINIVKSFDEFGIVDLSSYIPVKKGCTFKGWFVWDATGKEYKEVESIPSKDFVENDNLMLMAAWQADTLDESTIKFTLNANGGTIEGSASKTYNYVVKTSMDPFIIAYAKPVREGYTFDGWYIKDSQSGEEYKCTSLEWGDFSSNDGYIEVFAKWTKNAETEITTVSEIKTEGGNASFAIPLPAGSTLKIAEVKNSELLAQLKKTEKNLLKVFDISVIDTNNQIISIKDNEITIRLLLEIRLPQSHWL